MIRAYATARALPLAGVLVELGKSGTDPARPRLAALLARIESGASGGVVVARLDRLGRSVIETLRLLERIEAAGGRFVSVEDGFDSSLPLGRAMLTILLALAQLERDRLADSTREARTRAVERGIHQCASPPLGYRHRPNGQLEPEPSIAPTIRSAFERRAAGATYAEVAAFLVRAGMPPPQAGGWSGKRVYRLFQNPIYVGEAFSGVTRNPFAHEPLVSRALWLAAHDSAACAFENAHAASLLGGIIRCGSCHHPLRYRPSHAHSPNEPRARPPKYECRRHFPEGDCTAPVAAAAEPLERAVINLCLRRIRRQRPQPQLDAGLQTAERELALLEATTRRRKYQSAVYTSHDQHVAHARRALLRLWRQQQVAQLPPADQLRSSWPKLSHAERRRILQTAIDTSLLLPGEGPLEDRLKLVVAGSRADGNRSLDIARNTHIIDRRAR